MARGMLNGLRPYLDLFETKPPGMFFVFVLSLLVTGNSFLATGFQVGIFVGIPALLAFCAWKEKKNLGIAVLLGILLALYLQQRSGNFHAESFGAFFASAYLVHVFIRKKITKASYLVNTLLLGAAIGMKEPFVLTALAGVLLVARSPRHFVQVFVIPLVIAGVLGVCVLALLGYPYVSVYLPTILGNRLVQGALEPLWIKPFAVGRVLGNVTTFYTAPLLGVCLGALWLFAERRPLALSAAAALGYVLLEQTRVLLTVGRAIALAGLSLDGAEGFIAGRIGLYLALLLAFIGILIWQKNGRVLLYCVSLCLVSLSVGLAGYLDWHFGSAFPLFFALSLLFIRYGDWSYVSVAVMVILIAAGFLYQPSHIPEMKKYLRTTPADPSAFDALLDRCPMPYFLAGSRSALSLSRHSPVGPVFALDEQKNYLNEKNPLMQRTYANIRNEVQLIVLGNGKSLDDVLPGLQGFSKEPPPCAKDFSMEGLEFYYRTAQ